MKSLLTFVRRKGELMFVLSLIILFYLFDFQSRIFEQPHGIHFIRQTDCLSFVSNYYHRGFEFFSPRLFTLYNYDGRAVCEFPVLYYLTALLCLVVYEPVLILKLLTLLIVSAGFLYLFKLLRQLFESVFYAWVFSLLFLSSTVLLYYSVNVLPDPAALGCTLCGWYHIFNFKGKQRAPAWGFGFFTFASLLKVTFFMYPLAAVLYLWFINRQSEIPGKGKGAFVYFFISAGCVGLWNLFVWQYNLQNHAGSFLLRPAPLWDLTGTEIREVTRHVFYFWYAEYYYPTSQHLFIILLLFPLIFLRRMEKALLFLGSVLLCGCVAFVLLFFAQFKDHDYYLLTLLPALALLIAFSFSTLQKRLPVIFSNPLPQGVFLTICLLSLFYAGKKLKEREQRPPDKYSIIAKHLDKAGTILDSLEVSQDAKVLIYPDFTPNGGLYFANRQGWTISDKEKFKSVEENVSYIMIADTSTALPINGYKRVWKFPGFMLFRL